MVEISDERQGISDLAFSVGHLMGTMMKVGQSDDAMTMVEARGYSRERFKSLLDQFSEFAAIFQEENRVRARDEKKG